MLIRRQFPRGRALAATAVIAALIAALPGFLDSYAVGAVTSDAAIDVPAKATLGAATALTLRLPGRVAAVEGRVMLDTKAAEFVGVAPLGNGQTFAPVAVPGGYSFAAYGLNSTNGHTVLRLVVAGNVDGLLQAQVLIDAAADSAGTRITVGHASLLTGLQVGNGGKAIAAPHGGARGIPPHAGGPARDLFPDGILSVDDLDAFRSAWYTARTADNQCQQDSSLEADANGDGCIDVVDIQALLAGQGQPRAGGKHRPAGAVLESADGTSTTMAPPQGASSAVVAATGPFVVNSTADTPDVTQGNGICADAQGQCSLRAAIMEANWQAGDQRINFNLPGAAPVTIAVGGGGLPNFGSSTTRLYIDGYSQPGSQPNTADTGTNAIPGVEIAWHRRDDGPHASTSLRAATRFAGC